MVDAWLPYGRVEVCARVPTENLETILSLSTKAGTKDFEGEIRRSLEAPFGARRLSEIVGPEDNIILALNALDASIAKPVISSILGEISSAGLKGENLKVIFMQPIFHSKITLSIGHLKDELSSLGVSVLFHDASSENIYVGDTESGVKVYIDKVFAQSKVKIVASLIEPNPYALYRGGVCDLVLGLSSIETLRQIFMPALNAENPSDLIFKEAHETSLMLGDVFSINIVGSIKGEIIKAFAGDLERSFQEGIKVANEVYRVSIDRRTDIIIISAGGSPFDSSLFDACGCLENALKVVKRNGCIILVAECLQGYGDIEFQEAMLRFKGDLISLGRSLQKKFTIGGFVAYRFLRALKRAYVSMVSALPDLYVSEIGGLRIFRTVNEALVNALSELGRKSRVLVIPNGSLVIPELKEVGVTGAG